MKIYVDADACPVKKEIVNIAKILSIEVIMIMDTSHTYEDGYSDTIIVDKGRDSVDFVLINRIGKNDIVVTQDYGVATMALARQAYAINQNGRVYSEENIERLLFERHLSQELRKSGKRNTKHKKRSKEDNEKFEKAFSELCEKVLKNNR